MKSVLLYLFLVGIPLLGVLAILRAGERIAAPAAIGGRWVLESGFAEASPDACPAWPPGGRTPSFVIEQSGRYLALRFAGTDELTFSGALQDGTIRATRPAPARTTECDGTLVDVLEATLVAGPDGPERLVGRVSTSGCTPCAALDFTARLHTEG